MIDYFTKDFAISIIIPYYNNEDTIRETLNSLENQEFTNFEVILIEDKNSIPTKAEILNKKYTYSFKYFKNLAKAGASSNRNLGIYESKGKFLQFLDADDFISNNKLKSQIELIKEKESAISICRWGIFNKTIADYVENDPTLFRNWDPINYLSKLNGEFNMLTPIHSYLIPKRLLKLAGIWNEDITLGDDGEFMNRVIAKCSEIVFSNEATVYYRRGNVNSLSHQTNMISALSNYKCAKSYDNLILNEFPNNSVLINSVIRKYNLFFYWSYLRFPELAEKVEKDVKKLNGKINMEIGTRISKLGQKILGVKLYLKFRSYISN
jgi:glycosyltransferase involved in cell wall biosynthesis